MTRPLRLGTRGSLLAKAQSQQVADAVTAATGRAVELVIIRTRGDKVQDKPLAAVGGKGLFTKELEDALLAGDVDFAVHSRKDMPTDQPDGLAFLAIPQREDPRDVLIGATLDTLAQGAVVGTGSLRRGRQLAARRPDLVIEGIRGNVDTRIRKLHEGPYDAIVLAAAGLRRLGRIDEADHHLPVDVMIPAVGQGALALQGRAADHGTRALLGAPHHADTAVCVEAERGFLRAISGGCSVPAACHAVLEGDELHVRAMYAPEVDQPARQAELRGPRAQADALGARAAASVLHRG